MSTELLHVTLRERDFKALKNLYVLLAASEVCVQSNKCSGPSVCARINNEDVCTCNQGYNNNNNPDVCESKRSSLAHLSALSTVN